jgi:aryl-alcohol dehydrogenase-like predicted oxidoreductase
MVGTPVIGDVVSLVGSGSRRQHSDSFGGEVVKYRKQGGTGIEVSPYCLGAMMFGAMGNSDHDDSIRIIHRALDAGINVIDTADAYSHGESEEIVGKALEGRRGDVVLVSKMHYPIGDDPNRRGNSRRWIIAAVENSLRRLQTDHLDLYQVHRPDPTVDVEETLSALSDLIHSGKVRAIGTSTFPASEIVEAQWVAERRGLERDPASPAGRRALRRLNDEVVGSSPFSSAARRTG